jgi:hypothetical protein
MLENLGSTQMLNFAPKIKVGEFEFRETELRNPMFITLLALAIDPTPTQENLLNKSGVVIVDANKKQVWPREIKPLYEEIKDDSTENDGE